MNRLSGTGTGAVKANYAVLPIASRGPARPMAEVA